MGRDRHGRGLRGPMAWPRVPAMRTRGERFDEMVLESFDRICHRTPLRTMPLELAVEDVPPSDPAPWEERIALARSFPPQNGLPARVVVYRRPVESRARDAADLTELIDVVLTENVAGLLGVDPDDLKEHP